MDFLPKNAAGVYFRKRIRKDLQSVSLDADMIRMLMVIEEHKSLYQIAAEVEMDSAAFRKTLRRLLEQGLIETVQKAAPRLDKSFLQALRLSLTRRIGPIADIVIEDTINELKINSSDIAVEQAAELINRIALEIPDEDGRIQFKRSLMPILTKVKP